MIAVIICFIVSFFVFLTLGNFFILKTDKENFNNYNAFDGFFIGISVVGAFLNLWSLFFPTNGNAMLLLMVVSLVAFITNSGLKSKYRSFFLSLKNNRIFLGLILVFFAIFFVYAIIKPAHFDTYLYHMSSIQWIEQYRVVPGLANIQERLGFNSSIFVLSAGFSFYSWFGQNLFIINSLSLLIFSIWLLWIAFKKKGAIGLFALFFLYLFINENIKYISSPASDVLPNIFVGFLFISIVLNTKSLKNKYLLFIVLPLFAITLKISMAPVILLCFYALYIRDKNILSLLKKITLFGFAFVFPWLVRNVILSGYLIYPMDKIDLFSFEWKVPKEKVISVKSWIYSWAKDSSQDYKVVLSRSFGEWFPIWWAKTIDLNRVIFISAALAPVFGTCYAFFIKKKEKYTILLIVLISYITFLFWLNAPDFRFSSGVIIFLALLPLLLFEKLTVRFTKFYRSLLVVCIFISFFLIGQESYKTFRTEFFTTKRVFSVYIYKPVDPATIKIKKRIRFSEKSYFTPNHTEYTFYGFYVDNPCYDQFPCCPRLNDFKMRGEDLVDGFMSSN